MDPHFPPPTLYNKLQRKLEVLKMDKPLEERVVFLMSGWSELRNHCRSFAPNQVFPIMLCFRDQTLSVILCGQWDFLRSRYQTKLELSIRSCETQLIIVAPKFSHHIAQLLNVLQNPWGNAILKRILADPDIVITEMEYEFFRLESPYMILTRLKQLYNDRCEDLALNLVTALMKCCDYASSLPIARKFIMTADQTRYTFDVYIALLMKAKRTDEVHRELLELTFEDGYELVKRFTRKRADLSRLWRSASEVVIIAAATFCGKATIMPYEDVTNAFKELLQIWLQYCDEAGRLQQLHDAWIKLAPGSVTSMHMYAYCDTITPQYEEKMRYFRLKLLVLAISTDINMLERLKVQSTWNIDKENPREADADNTSNMVQEPDYRLVTLTQDEIEELIGQTTRYICQGFVRMSTSVRNSPTLLRESILTAFSICPSEHLLVQIEASARALGHHVVPCSTWVCSSHPPQQEGTSNPDDEELLVVCPNCGQCSTPLCFEDALKCSANPSIDIYEKVNEENPGIDADTKNDIVVLLFATRHQPLNWTQQWPEMHRLCNLFLRDQVSLKRITKDLDYAKYDYDIRKVFEKKKASLEQERIERRAEISRQEEAMIHAMLQSDSTDNGDNTDDEDWEASPKRKKRKRVRPRRPQQSSSPEESIIVPVASTSNIIAKVPKELVPMKGAENSTKLLRTFRHNKNRATAQPTENVFPFRDTFNMIMANALDPEEQTKSEVSKNGSHRSLNRSVRRTTTTSSSEEPQLPLFRPRLITKVTTEEQILPHACIEVPHDRPSYRDRVRYAVAPSPAQNYMAAEITLHSSMFPDANSNAPVSAEDVRNILAAFLVKDLKHMTGVHGANCPRDAGCTCTPESVFTPSVRIMPSQYGQGAQRVSRAVLGPLVLHGYTEQRPQSEDGDDAISDLVTYSTHSDATDPLLATPVLTTYLMQGSVDDPRPNSNESSTQGSLNQVVAADLQLVAHAAPTDPHDNRVALFYRQPYMNRDPRLIAHSAQAQPNQYMNCDPRPTAHMNGDPRPAAYDEQALANQYMYGDPRLAAQAQPNLYMNGDPRPAAYDEQAQANLRMYGDPRPAAFDEQAQAKQYINDDPRPVAYDEQAQANQYMNSDPRPVVHAGHSLNISATAAVRVTRTAPDPRLAAHAVATERRFGAHAAPGSRRKLVILDQLPGAHVPQEIVKGCYQLPNAGGLALNYSAETKNLNDSTDFTEAHRASDQQGADGTGGSQGGGNANPFAEGVRRSSLQSESESSDDSDDEKRGGFAGKLKMGATHKNAGLISSDLRLPNESGISPHHRTNDSFCCCTNCAKTPNVLSDNQWAETQSQSDVATTPCSIKNPSLLFSDVEVKLTLDAGECIQVDSDSNGTDTAFTRRVQLLRNAYMNEPSTSTGIRRSSAPSTDRKRKADEIVQSPARCDCGDDEATQDRKRRKRLYYQYSLYETYLIEVKARVAEWLVNVYPGSPPSSPVKKEARPTSATSDRSNIDHSTSGGGFNLATNINGTPPRDAAERMVQLFGRSATPNEASASEGSAPNKSSTVEKSNQGSRKSNTSKSSDSKDRSRSLMSSASKRYLSDTSINSGDRSLSLISSNSNISASKDRSLSLVSNSTNRSGSKDRSRPLVPSTPNRSGSKGRSRSLVTSTPIRNGSKDRSRSLVSSTSGSKDRSRSLVSSTSNRSGSKNRSRSLMSSTSNRSGSKDQSRSLVSSTSNRSGSKNRSRSLVSSSSYRSDSAKRSGSKSASKGSGSKGRSRSWESSTSNRSGSKDRSRSLVSSSSYRSDSAKRSGSKGSGSKGRSRSWESSTSNRSGTKDRSMSLSLSTSNRSGSAKRSGSESAASNGSGMKGRLRSSTSNTSGSNGQSRPSVSSASKIAGKKYLTLSDISSVSITTGDLSLSWISGSSNRSASIDGSRLSSMSNRSASKGQSPKKSGSNKSSDVGDLFDLSTIPNHSEPGVLREDDYDSLFDIDAYGYHCQNDQDSSGDGELPSFPSPDPSNLSERNEFEEFDMLSAAASPVYSYGRVATLNNPDDIDDNNNTPPDKGDNDKCAKRTNNNEGTTEEDLPPRLKMMTEHRRAQVLNLLRNVPGMQGPVDDDLQRHVSYEVYVVQLVGAHRTGAPAAPAAAGGSNSPQTPQSTQQTSTQVTPHIQRVGQPRATMPTATSGPKPPSPTASHSLCPPTVRSSTNAGGAKKAASAGGTNGTISSPVDDGRNDSRAIVDSSRIASVFSQLASELHDATTGDRTGTTPSSSPICNNNFAGSFAARANTSDNNDAGDKDRTERRRELGLADDPKTANQKGTDDIHCADAAGIQEPRELPVEPATRDVNATGPDARDVNATVYVQDAMDEGEADAGHRVFQEESGQTGGAGEATAGVQPRDRGENSKRHTTHLEYHTKTGSNGARHGKRSIIIGNRTGKCEKASKAKPGIQAKGGAVVPRASGPAINIISQQTVRPANVVTAATVTLPNHTLVTTQTTVTPKRAQPLINFISSQQFGKPVGAIVTSPNSIKTISANSKNTTATIINSEQLLQHTSQIVTLNNNNNITTTTTTTPQLVNSPRVMQIICKSADGRLIPVTSLANRVLKVTAAAASASGTIDLQGTTSETTTSSTLPKFNQVFGKTVYQTTTNSTNSTVQTQPITIKGNVQNLQGFQGIQGLQSLQGGVIYTRQMPVGVGQTINIIGGTPQSRQVFRIAAANNATGEQHLSLVKDTVIHSKMSALLAAALQGQKTTVGGPGGSNVVLVDHSHSAASGEQQQQSSAQASAPGTNKIHIRPTTLVQNVSLSSTTLEQLREFDMVYKQVTERSSTSTPADLANESTNAADQTQQPTAATTPTTTATVQLAAQPTQRISLAYVNNQGSLNKLNCAQLPLVVVSSYGTAGTIASNAPTVCPTKLVTAKVTKVSSAIQSTASSTTPVGTIKSKPTPPSTPTLTQSPSQQSSSQSSPQTSTSTSTKTSPIQPKPAAKPQEDEHTTQRIFDILAEYAEQLRNSPDLNNKPAPRRRSNPPTNPTTGGTSSSSKRKKSSSSSSAAQTGTGKASSKPSVTAQQSSSSSTDVDIDDGRTMGSEDSSGGPASATSATVASEGICVASSVPAPAAHITVATTPQQQSPPQTPKPTIVAAQQPHLIITDPTTNQTRNLIIADGTNAATAVLVPGNYLMPLTSMVKSGQQIAVVNAGGNKILAAVPAGRNIQHPANMLLFQSFLNQLPTQAQQRKTVVTTSCTTTNSGTTTTVKYSPILTTSSTNELLLRIAERNPVRTIVQQTQQLDVDGDVLMDGTASSAAGNGTTEREPTVLAPIMPIATSVIQGQAVQARDFTALANKHSIGKVGTQSVQTSTTSSVVRGVLNSIGRVTSVVVHPANSNNQSTTAVIIPTTVSATLPTSSLSAAVSVIESPQTSKEQTANVLLRNGGTCVGVKRTPQVQTIQQTTTCSTLNATATSKPITYYPSSSNLLKFRKLMTNAALKAEQQAPLQTLPLLQRRHAAAAAAVYERELRIQKSLSEECEDLGVDEPSASDLFPEAADLLVFDNNHSPTATSFDNLQIHHSTVSSTPDPQTVKHSITKQEKLTLFGDDDFLFDSDEYQTSNQSQMPQMPLYEEGNAAITTIVNGSDHTLLQTCASMSDVTMNSPVSPDYPVDRYAVHKYSNRKKQQLSPVAVVSHSSTSTSTSGSSNSGEDTTSTEDPMDSMDDNSRFVVMVKRAGHVAKRCCGRRKMRNRSCSCCNGVSIHEEDMDEITIASTTLVEEEVVTSPIASTIAPQQQVNSRKRSLPAMLAKRSTPLKKR